MAVYSVQTGIEDSFEALELLGEGSSGCVLLAKRKYDDGQTVAIKIFERDEDDFNSVESIENEIKIHQALH